MGPSWASDGVEEMPTTGPDPGCSDDNLFSSSAAVADDNVVTSVDSSILDGWQDILSIGDDGPDNAATAKAAGGAVAVAARRRSSTCFSIRKGTPGTRDRPPKKCGPRSTRQTAFSRRRRHRLLLKRRATTMTTTTTSTARCRRNNVCTTGSFPDCIRRYPST